MWLLDLVVVQWGLMNPFVAVKLLSLSVLNQKCCPTPAQRYAKVGLTEPTVGGVNVCLCLKEHMLCTSAGLYTAVEHIALAITI